MGTCAQVTFRCEQSVKIRRVASIKAHYVADGWANNFCSPARGEAQLQDLFRRKESHQLALPSATLTFVSAHGRRYTVPLRSIREGTRS